MTADMHLPQHAKPANAFRVGCVSYLNAKPLIYGLEKARDIELYLDVPSRLLGGLTEHRFDVALLPTIDYQRMDGLCMVPAGAIGCDGQTLTVRIFSREPIEHIRALACDTDSHTSVALARVVLAERYGVRPEFVDLGARPDHEARLLIGDKVISAEPAGFDHQLDLGSAWKVMTGLPFVFAVWMARLGTPLGELPLRLQEARKKGVAAAAEIVTRFAAQRGWPADVALKYLTVNLKFEIGEQQIKAMELFYQLAARHGAIAEPVKPLTFYK